MWTYKASNEQVNSFTSSKTDTAPARQTPIQPVMPQKRPVPYNKMQSTQPTSQISGETPGTFDFAGWRDETGQLLHTGSPVQPGRPAREAQVSQATAWAGGRDAASISQKTTIYSKKNARLLSLAYLAGLPAGSLAFSFLGKDAATYMEYYLDARLQMMTEPPLRIFSSQFLAAFLQLSLVLLCGFCAFGTVLLLLQAAVRGAVFGCFCAGLLARYSMQGALVEGLLFWLPEVLQAAIQIVLGACAARISLQLGTLCFDGKPQPGKPPESLPRQLISCYLVCCLAALAPCGLSALLGLLFGPILSGVVLL